MKKLGSIGGPWVFIHHTPTELLVGEGCLEKLSAAVGGFKGNCLLVAGRRAARLSGALDRVLLGLQAARTPVFVFDQVEPNPSIETVLEGAELARQKRVQWVLGLGGGSALDAAKAIALMAVSHQDIRDLLKGMLPAEAPLPIVALPTTAGSGSEVTPYAVLTDNTQGDKFTLNLPGLFPRLALLEPTLTCSMPEAVTIDSALSALCHAIEALFSRRRSVFSDLFSRAALDRIINILPVVRRDPGDLGARTEIQLAATFAGMAIADTAPQVPQTASYPVTVRYDLPHGRVTALLMPAFLEQVRERESDRVTFVGRVLGAPDAPAEALRNFISSLGIAPRLCAYGVKEKDLDLLSRTALDRPDNQNPEDWLRETLQDLYRRSI